MGKDLFTKQLADIFLQQAVSAEFSRTDRKKKFKKGKGK